jgi:riboflavin transporter FmnP
MIKASTSKGLSFIAMMAALGNVLSFISMQLSPLIPSIPLGPINFSLALDLSHLATFTAALLGGPVIGGLTGLVGGFVAAFQFGFSQGNIITGIGLPLGKAVTGIVAGIIMKRIKDGGWRLIAATVISYIPEAVFTAVIFIVLYPIYYGLPVSVAELITLQIIVKAFVEMVILGVLLKYISGSKPFRNITRSFAS